MTRFAEQLCDAGDVNYFGPFLQDVAPGWRILRVQSPLLEIPIPLSWRRVDKKWPDGHGLRLSFVPETAHVMDGDDAPTPHLEFWANGLTGAPDDVLLDFFENSMKETFDNPTILESEKTTLNGIKLLAAVYEYSRPSGRWRSLITLRVKDGVFFHYEAAGLVEHMTVFHQEFVVALANLRIYDSVASFEEASQIRADEFGGPHQNRSPRA